MGLIWCPVCSTEHTLREPCPGEIEPTGEEQEGWKVTVETPNGMQGYGVLLAEVGTRWRARVLTFPNILWTVPGGARTLKFLSRTRRDAEIKAMNFIRAHCAIRGYVMRDELELVPSRAPHRHQRDLAAGAASHLTPAERFERRLPVIFGQNKPVVPASTRNLSETGLFVCTSRPLGEGLLCGMILEMEHCKLPLRGSVAWCRFQSETARPAGMGLRLLEPPTVYTRYVRALA